MTAIESKEEISDTDSGIIVHSGPDSPTSPLKDGMTHTRALKLKHQALEERLELCLLELRTLCIREAELTGKLPSDYPLIPEEKPPRVRRRIGASFKLDEELIHSNKKEDAELHALETELALQRQIYEAARKLSLEDKLSKPQKKSRAQQCKREEKKVKELQEAVFQHRVKTQCNSPRIVPSKQHRDLNVSDDSSLSDVVALDEDVDSPCPLSPPATGHPFTDPLHLPPKPLQSCPVSSSLSSMDSERTPVQSSPWRESSLDHPYKKNNKLQNNDGSRSSSPAHVSSDCSRPLPSPFTKSSSLRYPNSTSAPSTPELHVRRQFSQSFRLPKSKPVSVDNSKGRGRLPQRRPEFILRSPQYSPLRLSQSSSEDTSSEHSSSSYISSPGREGPTEIPKLCPPPYGFHYGAKKAVSSPSPNKKTLRRNQGSKDVLDSPLSPQDLGLSKRFLSPPPVPRAQRQSQEAALSPKRSLKPPPPYRLVRTPSLKEYPNHAFRLLPREIVSEELKSWHQRNQQHKLWPTGEEGITSPTSPHMPPFTPCSGNLVLQRAADGTPLQWFVAQDSEIISQV
ncbi:innate immunity activator protein [Eucyclogobius newberryi]|uniref:innate immunity activator protein n=1 Tax=Eucyclogobius newberryi TaxID=166745 RepID=UPI003B59C657